MSNYFRQCALERTLEGELQLPHAASPALPRVLVPDFVFTHAETGRRVFMEVFGFWRKGAVESRLELLSKHGPENLILALSSSLATGREGLDDLPGEVYVFRTHPIARKVLKVLEGQFGS